MELSQKFLTSINSHKKINRKKMFLYTFNIRNFGAKDDTKKNSVKSLIFAKVLTSQLSL